MIKLLNYQTIYISMTFYLMMLDTTIEVIKIMLIPILSVDLASLVLRFVLAAIFVVHGYPKLKNLKGTAEFLGSSGFKPALFWALVLGVTEFFGGIALLLGLLSRVFSGLLIISMAVATLMKIVKWKVPFTKPNGETGWEYDAIILAGLIALFLLGSGGLSLDNVLLPIYYFD